MAATGDVAGACLRAGAVRWRIGSQRCPGGLPPGFRGGPRALQPSVRAMVVSPDNATWRTVHTTTAGRGGVENRGFAPTTARYVRVTGLERGTDNRYSIREIGVHGR